MVQIILTSTVVAAFITAIFNWIKLKRDQYSADVIKERAEWRKSVEKQAEEIAKTNDDKSFLAAVQRLKIYLNPYRSKNYLSKQGAKDEYLWKLIFQIEADQKLGNHFLLYQKQIIEMIGCLLKENWEKSKREAAGDMSALFIVIVWSICTSLFFGSLAQSEMLSSWGLQGITVAFMILGSGVAIVNLHTVFCFTEKLHTWVIAILAIGTLCVAIFIKLLLCDYFIGINILYKFILLLALPASGVCLFFNIRRLREEKTNHTETISIVCDYGKRAMMMRSIDSDLMNKIIELDCSQPVFNDLIQIFSMYISSNENYHYSEGYLLEAFKKFKLTVEQYKRKYEVLKSLGVKDLTTQCQEEWAVIFDNHFVISSLSPETIISFDDFLELAKKIKWEHYERLLRDKYVFYDMNKEKGVELTLLKENRADFYRLELDKIKDVVEDFFGGSK